MLEAMRAGVTEIVPEPVSQAALESAIGACGRRPSPTSHRARCLPSSAPRAASAPRASPSTSPPSWRARRPGEVLLIDFHLAQGDAAVLLGVEPHHSVVDALENTHRLDEAYFRGLVVQAEARARTCWPHRTGTSSARLAPTAFGTLVEFAARHYRYVVLDLPRADLTILDGLDARAAYRRGRQPGTRRRSAAPRGWSRASGQRYTKERISLALARFDKGADIVPADIEKVVGMPVSASSSPTTTGQPFARSTRACRSCRRTAAQGGGRASRR